MFLDKSHLETDTWAEFCSIPETALAETQRVLMFPHNTDLYFCCGQKAWKKTFNPNFIAPKGSAFVAWKDHYDAQWVQVDDDIIPADAKAVIPLLFYDNDTDILSSGLASLTVSGKIQCMQQKLEKGSRFTEMTCKSNNTPSQYKHIAFFNGYMIAIGDDDRIWHLQPTAQGTYTSLCSTPGKSSIDRLIATEAGVVAQIGADLYNCIPEVMPVSKDTSPQSVMKWTKSIECGDVTTMCGASPGVTMNFDVLVRSLQRRYREGQKGLVPVVVKLSSFAQNHVTHLELLQSDSKQCATFGEIISDSKSTTEEISKATLFRDQLLTEARRDLLPIVNIHTERCLKAPPTVERA